MFVDDGLVLSKSLDAIDVLTNELKDCFEIVTNEPNIFVGVQIERNRDERFLRLHQSEYALKILNKFNMMDANPVCTPADISLDLRSNESSDDMQRFPFRELVGLLMFLCNVTRPDLAYSVNVISRYVNNYNKNHWEAGKRILKYLKGTLNHGISYCYDNRAFNLTGYCDSDFAGDVSTRRSTSGYVFELASGPVTWTCQRQKSVAVSTTAAEYVSASLATREAVWLRKLLNDLGHQTADALVLYVDNQNAIRLIKNPEFHKRTKHIDTQYHFVRDQYEANVIDVKYIPSENQKADIFTKALPRDRFKRLCDAIGVRN